MPDLKHGRRSDFSLLSICEFLDAEIEQGQGAQAPESMASRLDRVEERLEEMDKTLYELFKKVHHNSATSAKTVEIEDKLEKECRQFFKDSPDCSPAQVNWIATRFLGPSASIKLVQETKTAIRRHFRTFRNMNGRRVFAVCEQFLQGYAAAGMDAPDLYAMLMNDDSGILTSILNESHLDIEDYEAARAFCKAKVESFFQRRVFNAKTTAINQLSFSEP